ncbi:hypothetical protein Bpfe_023295, partial [Biomphalaria pfeifferi]
MDEPPPLPVRNAPSALPLAAGGSFATGAERRQREEESGRQAPATDYRTRMDSGSSEQSFVLRSRPNTSQANCYSVEETIR